MLNELEKAIVRELQGELPLVARPFKVIAERLGIEEEELIQKTKEMKEKGLIRRFGAAVRHRKIGFVANAMVVWIVPRERVEEVGKIMASFPEVTHCYERPTSDKWPYNLFTMIHGKSNQECEKIIEEIASKTQIQDYHILYSIKELKKTSMRYFVK